MTLMEKHSNVNRIFESNKFGSGHQQRQLGLSGQMEVKVTPCKIMKNKSKNIGREINNEHELESRRSSGNSITIKITNDNNVTMDDQSLENILNENFSILNEFERNNDIEVEETTSNSNSLEQLERQQSKKKSLKERKKLVRSSAQQKHHLVCQESEDQPEALSKPFESQNTAFDALFAAANTGNFIQSAHVEAQMAIAASKTKNHEAKNADDASNKQINRNNSFRNRCSFKKVSPSSEKAENNSQEGSNSKLLNPIVTGLMKSGNDAKLGSPQQLTRSQSCKRPGSFKRLRAKQNGGGDQANSKTSPTTIVPGAPANVSGRRGTHGSIILADDINRTSSLPFENMEEVDPDICRVRQFNITNKGIVNRGDSFKRSFKRSNNSISSTKKDISPSVVVNHDGNTLNLPELYDGFFVNKSCNNSSNFDAETTSKSNQSGIIDNNSLSLNGKQKPDPAENKSYLVYMIGASSVGKNALIKQFKTSEYRGTYDVDTNQSADDSNEGVNIALDGIESILTFVSMDIDMLKLSTMSLFEITKANDAFIVVYSISDKASFNIAIDLLKSIRLSNNKDQPVILVGNKSDLVRKRSISREDAGTIALKFGCKFVETSVAINDKVDDLLAGILKQIRLHEGVDKDSIQLKENSSSNCGTSFVESNSIGQDEPDLRSRGRHRNYSDPSVEDLSRLNSTPFSHRNTSKFLSFRSGTLSRRLFRPKCKENQASEMISDSEKKKKFAKIHFSDQQSFFHKMINNIFKRRSNMSNLGSVENLYTPPCMN